MKLAQFDKRPGETKEMEPPQKIFNNDFTISKSAFVTKNQQPINVHYQFLKKLGNGSFGIVSSVRHKQTGVIRACKTINRRCLNQKAFKNELNIMKQADHPNVIQLYEYFENSKSV